MISIDSRDIFAAAVIVSAFSLEAPRVKRIETLNFSNLMARVDTAYVAPGKTKEYYIYGPWMDYASQVKLLNSSQTIVEKKALYNSDGGLLRVNLTVPAGTSRGVRTATVTIACPMIPFTDCASTTRSFPVMVLGVGTLTKIEPKTAVAANQYQSFKITGTGLDNSTVFLFRTDLRAITVTSNSATTLEFKGSTSACGTNRVRVRDVAEGGDFYAFPGGLDISLATSCALSPVSGSTTISGGSTLSGPDLQPIIGAPVFRHLAPNRKVASEPYCHGMFAQATTAIVKTITVGDLIWGVKNTGGSTAKGFHALLFRGGVKVADVAVDSLRAGASRTFTLVRNPSQTEVARLALVPNASTQQIYNATGGECVQTVGQDSQFDWQDPQWQIQIDPAGAVANDINKSNNNRSF
jgi:hypothetical protein